MAGLEAATLSSTEKEINSLKEKYGSKFKIIKDIGEFAYVLKFSPTSCNISLKFQLTKDYPTKDPEVVVNGLGTDLIVADDVENYIRSKLHKNSVTEVIDMVIKWLDEDGLSGQQGAQGLTELTEPTEPSKKNQKKKKNKENQEATQEKVSKKASMKTAEDVIKRIQWDSNLQSDQFTIGYLDRFLGVMEKGFFSFSWEDLASVDYNTLAIPKHRIQYFKYKSVKVWDKNERLDNVFGSTGSGLTITDVIQSIGDSNPALQSQLSNASDHPCPNASLSFVVNDSDTTDDDDSDDDGVSVTIGASVNQPSGHIGADDDEEEGNDHWQNKMRPNYFLCQRITDPKIAESVAHMQDQILERTSGYDGCIIPPVALHVTLCTLGLDTQELVQEASQLLHRIQGEMKEMLGSGIELECSGVGNFFGRVVYGKIKHGKDFIDYVEHLRALVREAGLEIRDNHSFVPHMTILKVTRPAARITGRKTVPAWMYDEFKDCNFGKQSVDGIYLCEMKADKGIDGFYITPANINFKDEEK